MENIRTRITEALAEQIKRKQNAIGIRDDAASMIWKLEQAEILCELVDKVSTENQTCIIRLETNKTLIICDTVAKRAAMVVLLKAEIEALMSA